MYFHVSVIFEFVYKLFHLKKHNFLKNKIKDRWKKLTISAYLSYNVFYTLLVVWILITHNCDASSDVDYLIDMDMKMDMNMDMEMETTKTVVYLLIK